MIKPYFSFLCPPNCTVCSRTITKASELSCMICQSCQSHCKMISGDVCAICGKTLISEIRACITCRNRDYAFGSNKAVFRYDDVAGLVAAYKFRAHKSIARYFVSYIYDIYTKYYAGLPLVPIPSSKKGRKTRGFDQSFYQTSLLHKLYDIPVLYILKCKRRKIQKNLSYTERLHNLTGNVILKRHVKYKHLILFDDVFTSGSTLHAYAKLLTSEGYTCDALTIAID